MAPPGDVAAAVALFAERYPALGERPWAEILGDIIDDDAYRGIVDPMWAGNRRTQIDRNGVAPWVNAAALTVYYVNVAKGQDTPPRFHAVMTLAIAARRQSGLEEVVT